MAAVLNRTTKQYSLSVNTPDYPEVDWIINPDISAVQGFDTKYWIITGDVVTLMSAAQRDAVDDQEMLALATGQAAFQVGAFGDGQDGIITLAGNATLAQDKYYQQITVQTGVVATGGGFRLFADEYVNNNGSIIADGGNAAAATAGTGAPAGTLRGGANGASGGTGAGANGTSLTTGAAPGAGGGGGNGGTGNAAGGSGGTVLASSALRVRPRRAFAYFDLGDADAAQASLYALFSGGAGGGAGGGGGGGNNGGAGGGGGGCLCIGTPGLLNNGIISAGGGNGGNGGAGGNTGSGGGGGGGLGVLGRLYLRGTGTATVPGGATGSPGGTGTVGTAGSAGTLLDFILRR